MKPTSRRPALPPLPAVPESCTNGRGTKRDWASVTGHASLSCTTSHPAISVFGRAFSALQRITKSARRTYDRAESLVAAVDRNSEWNTGIPLVVASHWEVDSTATAKLMSQFHKLRKADGLSSIGALRRAQLDMLEHPRYRDPFFWAPFITYGAYVSY